MHGLCVSDMAGDSGLRFGRGLRQPRRTWLKVAEGWGVVVKVRGRRSGVVGLGGGRKRRRGRRVNIVCCGRWGVGEVVSSLF